MSAPAPELTRAQIAAAKTADRLGACGCGRCTCDVYEPAGVKDGFATCVCHHTQWSHARVSVSP